MFGCVSYVQHVCVGCTVLQWVLVVCGYWVCMWGQGMHVFGGVLESRFCMFLCVEYGNVCWRWVCVCVWVGGGMLDVHVCCVLGCGAELTLAGIDESSGPAQAMI